MERTEADFGKLCEKIGSFNWKELNLYLLQSRELFGFWHLFSGLISYCHYSINSLNYGQWTLSCFSVIFIIGKLRSTVHVFVHKFNLLYTGHLLLVHWMLSVVCRAWTHRNTSATVLQVPLSACGFLLCWTCQGKTMWCYCIEFTYL